MPRTLMCALALLAATTGGARSAEPTPVRDGVVRAAQRHAASPPRHGPGHAAASPAFEGYWGADRKACLDPDSAGRMAIGAGTIAWYETRCRIAAIEAAGRAAWRMDLACRGEGENIRARARVSLPTADALIIDDGPIGPSRRQRYIRCLPR